MKILPQKLLAFFPYSYYHKNNIENKNARKKRSKHCSPQEKTAHRLKGGFGKENVEGSFGAAWLKNLEVSCDADPALMGNEDYKVFDLIIEQRWYRVSLRPLQNKEALQGAFLCRPA